MEELSSDPPPVGGPTLIVFVDPFFFVDGSGLLPGFPDDQSNYDDEGEEEENPVELGHRPSRRDALYSARRFS